MEFDETLSEDQLARLQQFKACAQGEESGLEMEPQDAEVELEREVGEIVDKLMRPIMLGLFKQIGYAPPNVARRYADELVAEDNDDE